MTILSDILGPRRSFEGGLFLPDYKAGTAKRPIEALTVHERLRVPLCARRDLVTRPVVRPGQRVLRGQVLAVAGGPDSLPAHAPTSGKVVELGRAWTALDGFVPCAILDPDGLDEAVENPERWEEDSFVQEIHDAGVMCSTPREPLERIIRRANATGVTDLIVNAMETEPYLTGDLRTLVEEPGRVIEATAEIADALGAAHVYIALPSRHRRVVKRIEWEARGRHIHVVALAHKYPQCQPIVLLKTVLDREVVPGGSPIDAEALVLPLSAVREAARALLDGRPSTHALMTIAGDAVDRPGTYRVAVGTSVTDLAKRVGLLAPPELVVWGGPLSGITLQRSDAVVTRETGALLMFQDASESRPVPCVRCGWCVEDCPVGLDPSALMHLEAQDRCGPGDRTLLRACVDCGLCSHVCPSQLPLAESIWRARRRFDDE